MIPHYYVAEEGYVRVDVDEENNVKPLVVLKSRLAKRFSGLGLIKKDLSLVKASLLLLQEGVDNKIIKQSLSFFAVVTYAKCYTKAEGRGVTLDISNVKNLTKVEREEHTRLLDQRHQYIAHGGKEGWEQNAIVASLNVTARELDQIYPNVIFLNDIDSQIPNILSLLNNLDLYVNSQLRETFSKLKVETSAIEFDKLLKESFTPDIGSLQYF